MIHAAHTSRYHWEYAGKAVNLAKGEWLISRVYTILNGFESCFYHADRCLQITNEDDLKDFDLAFVYKAMDRACKLEGDEVETAKYVTLTREMDAKLTGSKDRQYFFNELETIRSVEVK
jgi:hypothetical protein